MFRHGSQPHGVPSFGAGLEPDDCRALSFQTADLPIQSVMDRPAQESIDPGGPPAGGRGGRKMTTTVSPVSTAHLTNVT
jgi:hypothetical protein